MKYLSDVKAWQASDGSMFDYQSECEDHEAFLSKASIPKSESETRTLALLYKKILSKESTPKAGSEASPIALLYEEMKKEYQEIRVDEYFRNGFKYAMSFVEGTS